MAKGPVCTKCGQVIEGSVERLTQVADEFRSAHFFCYYDKETLTEGQFELPEWALTRLQELDPERAKYFKLG